jgi:hypothetical protein
MLAILRPYMRRLVDRLPEGISPWDSADIATLATRAAMGARIGKRFAFMDRFECPVNGARPSPGRRRIGS